ncbi:outer membrane lipoprotein-sorting protein [Candidatus Poribacteria bacterium]|nr:MAG: outer membrane lipoprotein-sorting protein [Candidatus Poribacteria bacterium]
MRLRLALSIGLAFLLGLGAAYPELTGEEVMRRVKGRDDGEDMIADTTMKLINKRGQVRVRKVRMFRKDYEDGVRKIIFFLAPADVKGTAFLSWDPSEGEGAQWIYIPALRKVRRIASSRRGDYFMGTDFTYEDLGEWRVEDYRHKLIGEEVVDGHKCYVVESVPKEKGKSVYGRKVAWVREDIWMIVRADFYDKKGRFIKRMTVPRVEKVNGIWTAMELRMDNERKRHKTIILIEDVKYNTGIPDDMFTQRAMIRGAGLRS